MKKFLLTIAALAMMLVPILLSAQDGTWVRKADFGGTARNGAVTFSVNNKGYAGTGYTGALTNDFWQYDPATDTWAQVASLPADARSDGAAFAINDKGYVCLGISNSGYTRYNDLWEYDGVNNSWTRRADFPGNLAYDVAAFSTGGKGYVGAGLGAYGVSNEFWEYNPANDTWTRRADFPGEYRFTAVGLGIGTKGYIGTGTKYYTSNYERLNDFWQYDPATDTWTQKANVGGLPRWLAMGFTIGGTGYIGCGINYANSMRDVWAYDTLQNTWTQIANLPVDKQGGVGLSINGKGYFGMGWQTNDFWQLDTSFTLILGTPSKTTFCSGVAGNFSIHYTAKGNFTADNTFSLKLFDEYNYYFHDTITVGTSNSNTSGIINATIPDTLPTGSYYVLQLEASDPAIKSDMSSQTISIVDPQISVSPNISNPVCSGNGGAINLNVSGGDGNYQYLWDDASTGNSRNMLAEGNYFVIVNDPGCSADTQNITLVNVAPAPPSFDYNSHIAVDSSFLHFYDAPGAGSYAFLVLSDDQTDTIFNARLTGPDPSFVLRNLQPSRYYVIQSKSYCPGFTDSSGWSYDYIYTPCTSEDPTVFGNNVWKVYAFTEGDSQDYGYSWLDRDIDGAYVDSSLSFDTRNRWDSTSNPTHASGYDGCGYVYDDYFSWSAKRKGFSCGKYVINIPAHDDEAQLFINGEKVWEHIDCCDSDDSVWIGELNDTSTVEFRVTEGGGNCYGSIQFIPVQPAITAPTDISVAANNTGCTASGINLGNPVTNLSCAQITNNAPALFAVGITTVTWTVTDAYGNTAQAQQHVTVTSLAAPAKPGAIAGKKKNLCGGGTFTYSIAPVANATFYNWQVPAGFVVQNNGASADITIPSGFTGTANISVAAANACYTSAAKKAVLYATSNNIDKNIVGPVNVNSGEKNVLYHVANTPGSIYTWQVPADAIIKSGQGTNRIRVNFGASSGNIQVNASNACGATVTGQLFITVGSSLVNNALAKAQGVKTGLSVYPNPAFNTARVVFTGEELGKKYELKITDLAGKTLAIYPGVSKKGRNEVEIELGRFTGGAYFIVLDIDNRTQTLKLVVAK